MATQPFAALEAQLYELDQDRAERVARLVFECQSSLELALLAVQDADRTAQLQEHRNTQLHLGRRLAHALRIEDRG